MQVQLGIISPSFINVLYSFIKLHHRLKGCGELKILICVGCPSISDHDLIGQKSGYSGCVVQTIEGKNRLTLKTVNFSAVFHFISIHLFRSPLAMA